MDCQIVERATLVPGQCMFSGTGDGPMLDFLRDFGFDNVGRIYISLQYATEIGRKAGLVDPSPERDEEISRLQAELDQAHEEIAALETVVDSIDILESHDFRARRKTGRPTKIKEPVNG